MTVLTVCSTRSRRPLSVLSSFLIAILAYCACSCAALSDESPGATPAVPPARSEASNESWERDVIPDDIAQPAGPTPQNIVVPTVGPAMGALSGRIVFMGAGHGWTHSGTAWGLQRGITHEMNEDYGNLDQMNIFAAYCFNAGATVVPTRPLGQQTNEVVLDNDSPGVTFIGSWIDSTATLFFGTAGDVPYRYAAAASSETATALYTPRFPKSDFYPVYTWVAHGDNRTNQLYRILHAGGESAVSIPHHLVGNGWVYLGSYYFESGSNALRGAVAISNFQPGPSPSGVVIADAIRFGNGMGNITRGGTLSSYPREEEAAKYWIQASLGQGMSASIPGTGTNDVNDNVGAPIRMAREMNRTNVFPGIYRRIYISFHSNAGGGRGTVGLYNDAGLFPGTATPNQFRLAQLLGKEVNDDLVALAGLEVPWLNRGANIIFARNDFAFGEIRNDTLNGEMDATIIEVAFHDSIDDARLLRDPKVRVACARASYQAVVRYMNEFDGGLLAFVPEPPRHLRAISSGTNILLNWSVPIAAGGSGAPQGYRLYYSTNGYAFRPAGPTTPQMTATFTPGTDAPYYFRVSAVNAGGESFPSEVAGCRVPVWPDQPRVLVVNGFDRFDRFLNVRQTPGVRNYVPVGVSGTMERVIPRLNNAFDYVVQYGEALLGSGVAFDSGANESVIAGSILLTNYPAVLWILGNESTGGETFAAAEQSALGAYMRSGGHVFVSGAEIAWDLDRSSGPTTADRDFLHQDLHTALNGDLNDDAQSDSVTADPQGIFAGNPAFRFGLDAGGAYAVAYPDVLTLFGSNAVAAVRYSGGLGGTAGVQFGGGSGRGRLVYFGFPFEAIPSANIRRQYMRDISGYFDLIHRPSILAFGSEVEWSSVTGLRYQVQSTGSLSNPTWQNIGSVVTATGSTSAIGGVTPTEPERYLRVVVVE